MYLFSTYDINEANKLSRYLFDNGILYYMMIERTGNGRKYIIYQFVVKCTKEQVIDLNKKFGLKIPI